VRVATSETLAATFLMRELAPLHEEHPGIELERVTGAVSLNLLKREADVALRSGQRPTQQSLVVRRLGAIAWGIYGSAAYVERHVPVAAGATFEGRDVISFDDDLNQIPPARWLAERAAGARVVMRTNSILSAAEAARAGWGLAALPSFFERQTSGLVRAYPELVTPVDVWLVVHPDLQHTGRVRAVLDHLSAAMHRAAVFGAPV